MNRNRTRADFKQDILIALGEPIIKVNLADVHLDNCINQALKIFWRWHHDGSFENHYLYEVVQEDVDRGWFTLPENIDTVMEVLPSRSKANFASAEWQLTVAAYQSANRFSAMNLVDYVAARQQQNNTRKILTGDLKLFTYVRIQHRVIPQFVMVAGDVIPLRVIENVDPESTDPGAINSSLVFDNELLKSLTCAYAKQLWGSILRRFEGMTMPGGLQINGQVLIDEGDAEEAAAMERLKSETVVGFFSV